MVLDSRGVSWAVALALLSLAVASDAVSLVQSRLRPSRKAPTRLQKALEREKATRKFVKDAEAEYKASQSEIAKLRQHELELHSDATNIDKAARRLEKQAKEQARRQKSDTAYMNALERETRKKEKAAAARVKSNVLVPKSMDMLTRAAGNGFEKAGVTAKKLAGNVVKKIQEKKEEMQEKKEEERRVQEELRKQKREEAAAARAEARKKKALEKEQKAHAEEMLKVQREFKLGDAAALAQQQQQKKRERFAAAHATEDSDLSMAADTSVQLEQATARQAQIAWARAHFTKALPGKECPSGWKPVLEKELCQKAFLTLGGVKNNVDNMGIWEDHPTGCFVRVPVGRLDFNDGAGRLNNEDEQICTRKDAASKEELRRQELEVIAAEKAPELQDTSTPGGLS